MNELSLNCRDEKQEKLFAFAGSLSAQTRTWSCVDWNFKLMAYCHDISRCSLRVATPSSIVPFGMRKVHIQIGEKWSQRLVSYRVSAETFQIIRLASKYHIKSIQKLGLRVVHLRHSSANIFAYQLMRSDKLAQTLKLRPTNWAWMQTD